MNYNFKRRLRCWLDIVLTTLFKWRREAMFGKMLEFLSGVGDGLPCKYSSANYKEWGRFTRPLNYKRAIRSAFTWSDTEQGYDFWLRVYRAWVFEYEWSIEKGRNVKSSQPVDENKKEL